MHFPLSDDQVSDSFIHGLYLMIEEIRKWQEEKKQQEQSENQEENTNSQES